MAGSKYCLKCVNEINEFLEADQPMTTRFLDIDFSAYVNDRNMATAQLTLPRRSALCCLNMTTENGYQAGGTAGQKALSAEKRRKVGNNHERQRTHQNIDKH